MWSDLGCARLHSLREPGFAEGEIGTALADQREVDVVGYPLAAAIERPPLHPFTLVESLIYDTGLIHDFGADEASILAA